MNARSLLFLAILPLLAASSCPAQEETQDEFAALKLLLSHSDAVVAVTSVKSEIGPRFGAWYVNESFKDVVTLAGEPMPKTMTVEFKREFGDDTTPFKPGQRFILFLKCRHITHVTPAFDVWELTDNLFGCQPYTKFLEGCAKGAAEAAALDKAEKAGDAKAAAELRK